MADTVQVYDDPSVWLNRTTRETSAPVGGGYDDVFAYNNSRIGLSYLVKVSGNPIALETQNGYMIFCVGFDEDGGYLGPTRGAGYIGGWKSSPATYDMPNWQYVGIVLRRSDNAAMSVSEAADAKLTLAISWGGCFYD